MCNPKLANKTVIRCPRCAEEMIRCTIDGKSGRLQVAHYPGMKNIAKTATFDVSEEIEVRGTAFSREARRMSADGRLFLSECSGLCLSCSDPFTVYRIVQTSGPLPNHLSAVDFEHGYRHASIYQTGQDGFANAHLLQDVLHHGNYYGCWLEIWSDAALFWTLDETDIAELVDSAIIASHSVGALYRDEHRNFKAEARIS